MRIIGYKKTIHGSAVVFFGDVDLNSQPSTALERYEAFFQGVPLWGGKGWETMSVDDILSIFRKAALDIVQIFRHMYDVAVHEHACRHWFIRWYRELRGWKPPPIPSEQEILLAMADRCKGLSDWMEVNQYRPFYVGSNMSQFVNKPKAVAQQLVQKS